MSISCAYARLLVMIYAIVGMKLLILATLIGLCSKTRQMNVELSAITTRLAIIQDTVSKR
jgi:hypothetical protein